MVFFCLEPESTFSILDILQLLIKLYTTVEASDEKILSSEKEPDVGSRRKSGDDQKGTGSARLTRKLARRTSKLKFVVNSLICANENLYFVGARFGKMDLAL